MKPPFASRELFPSIPLEPGEQYRFHFDAALYIGCACCVVACNEQNNNPAEVNWRRIGELESGSFPDTKRFHLSMSCNHCLDPACMNGCPTRAYEKDPITGAVLHSAELCIGCQYCTWNCPYGAPQYNAERRIVTKCDMCHGRITAGEAPACVEACPAGAIALEKINIEEWKKEWSENGAGADAPGLPPSEITQSTTRITLPANIHDEPIAAGSFRVEPEHSHFSLISFLTLTQLAVGGFLSLWLMELGTYFHGVFASGVFTPGAIGPLAMIMVASVAMISATFHLGRPIYAYRALRGLRTSWLSREVAFVGAFAALAPVYALTRLASIYLGHPVISPVADILLGLAVVLSGMLGIWSGAKIYMTPARPSWNRAWTPLRFFLTAGLLGPYGALLVGAARSRVDMVASFFEALLFAVLLGASGQGATLFYSTLELYRAADAEKRGSASLLLYRFRRLYVLRLLGLLVGGIVTPVILYVYIKGGSTPVLPAPLFFLGLFGFLATLVAELIGRHLFFVTAAPRNMAGGFFKK